MAAYPHQIGAPADGDAAAVCQADRLRRVQRHQSDRLRQVRRTNADEMEGCLQHGKRDVVRGQDVEEAEPKQFDCRDVARMRATAHDIRRAHQDMQTSNARSGRRFQGRRELGDAHTQRQGLVDMGDRRIVMGRQRDAALPAYLGDIAAVSVGEFRRLRQPLAAETLERGVREAELLLVICPVRLEIGELPLAGRMVHQRDELQEGIAGQSGKACQHVRGGNFAAQMDVVVGAHPFLVHGPADHLSHLDHFVGGERGVLVGADPERVEDRGDARASDLGIVRLNGGHLVPQHLRPRHEMPLDMVGMQLDEAGDKCVAVHVLPGPCRALADLRDQFAVQDQVPVDDPIGGDDAGVGQNCFVRHVRWFSGLRACGVRMAPAAAFSGRAASILR